MSISPSRGTMLTIAINISACGNHSLLFFPLGHGVEMTIPSLFETDKFVKRLVTEPSELISCSRIPSPISIVCTEYN